MLGKGTRGSGSCWLGAVAGSVGVRGVEATRCRLVDESIGRSDPSCRLTRFPGQARYLASAAWTLLIPKYDSLDLGHTGLAYGQGVQNTNCFVRRRAEWQYPHCGDEAPASITVRAVSECHASESRPVEILFLSIGRAHIGASNARVKSLALAALGGSSLPNGGSCRHVGGIGVDVNPI